MKIISSKYSTQAVEFLDVEAPQESIFFKQGSTRNILKKVILNIFKRKNNSKLGKAMLVA